MWCWPGGGSVEWLMVFTATASSAITVHYKSVTYYVTEVNFPEFEQFE